MVEKLTDEQWAELKKRQQGQQQRDWSAEVKNNEPAMGANVSEVSGKRGR